MVTDLKTRPELMSALDRATTKSLTARELHDQRVSFIMGSVNDKGGVTRARVEEVLAKNDGDQEA